LCGILHKTGLYLFRCITGQRLPYQVDMIARDDECIKGYFLFTGKMLKAADNYLFVFIGF
jgi:hypothetical protein